MTDKKYNPTESELEILEILWEQGPQSVKYVNDLLQLKRNVGYTTTLKIMQIMNDKKLVLRDTSKRSHIYEANVKKQAIKTSLVDKFILSTFNGSAKSLVMQILESDEISATELEEIKALIDKNDQHKNN